MANRAELLNDGEEAQRLILDGRQSRMWTALPGIILSVDLEAMTCVVQPAIQGTVEDENGALRLVDLPQLADVPIVFPSAGGFTITMPIAAGDEVLVVFASRCIDAWWQLGANDDGVSLGRRPMEARMHDLSDGFALPGPRSQPRVIDDISSDSVQIRNDEGTAYVEITADGKIRLVSGEGIEVDGDLSVTGDIETDGAIEAGGDVVGGALTAPISLTTHVHTSAIPGNPTSPPLP